MTPYYEADGVVLYHGDATDIVPRLHADLVLTDIPYGEVNRPSSGLRNLDKGSANDLTMPLPVLSELLFSAGARALVAFCGWEQESPLLEAIKRRRWTPRRGGWLKTNPSPMNGQHRCLSDNEAAAIGQAPGAEFAGRHVSPFYRGPCGRPVTEHPTEKPVRMMKHFISSSSIRGDVVLDPFAGSGSTLVAALALGRRAIGIELEVEWCKTIARRLENVTLSRTTSHAVRLTCDTCGKRFKGRRRSARYCSRSCQQHAYRQRAAARAL